MTEKTTYMDWDEPVFPSDNLAAELDALFDQIDQSVYNADGSIDISDDGSLVMSGPSDLNFGTGLDVTDDGDGTVTMDALLALGDLSDVDATGEGAGGGFDADLLDGKHASEFVLAAGDAMSGNLDMAGNTINGLEGARYSPSGNDFWNITDGSGGSNGSPMTVRFDGPRDLRFYNGGSGSAGSMFTLKHGGGIRFYNEPVTGLDQVFLAEGTNTNINGNNYVSWSNTRMNDAPFSFNGTNLTFQEAGTYEMRADADFSSANARTNPNLYIEYYNGSWNWAGVLGRSGYMRNASGHNNSSVHASAIKEVASGDQIRVYGAQEAQSETIVPNRSQFYVKKLNR